MKRSCKWKCRGASGLTHNPFTFIKNVCSSLYVYIYIYIYVFYKFSHCFTRPFHSTFETKDEQNFLQFIVLPLKLRDQLPVRTGHHKDQDALPWDTFFWCKLSRSWLRLCCFLPKPLTLYHPCLHQCHLISTSPGLSSRVSQRSFV
jgi:hypothetical protein